MSLPRATRELTLLGAALVFGVLVVPLLIWAVGNRVLGPYTRPGNTNAGPLALLQDFLTGLGHGFITYWLVALGPVLIIGLLRLFIALLRSPENK